MPHLTGLLGFRQQWHDGHGPVELAGIVAPEEDASVRHTYRLVSLYTLYRVSPPLTLFPQQQTETPTPNSSLLHHLIQQASIRLHSPPITPVLRLRRIEPHAHNRKARPVNNLRRMHERRIPDRHATEGKVIGNEVAADFRLTVMDIEVL